MPFCNSYFLYEYIFIVLCMVCMIMQHWRGDGRRGNWHQKSPVSLFSMWFECVRERDGGTLVSYWPSRFTISALNCWWITSAPSLCFHITVLLSSTSPRNLPVKTNNSIWNTKSLLLCWHTNSGINRERTVRRWLLSTLLLQMYKAMISLKVVKIKIFRIFYCIDRINSAQHLK